MKVIKSRKGIPKGFMLIVSAMDNCHFILFGKNLKLFEFSIFKQEQ